jgi:N-acyl-D-aspartate/D-glutamate deacylase
MDRRRFLGSSAAAGIVLLLHERELWSATSSRAARYVLRGATVYDGTGRRPLVADVALDGDHIIGIGRRLQISGAEEIDLRDLALAPGFIDIHSHTNLVLFANPKAESKIRQGITTEIAVNDVG